MVLDFLQNPFGRTNVAAGEKNASAFNESATVPSAPADAIPFEEAMQVFDELADRTDIAFGYSNDGCYARAHLMCLIMNAKGLTPKKAWAFEGADPLRVKDPNGKTVSWWYHVAAVLPVKMPDGIVQDMVFDPGLFDGPVSAREWGDIMRAHPDKVSIAPFTEPSKETAVEYYPHGSTPILDAYGQAVRCMSSYLTYQDKGPRTVFQSQSRQQFCHMQGSADRLQGKTWQSTGLRLNGAWTGDRDTFVPSAP